MTTLGKPFTIKIISGVAGSPGVAGSAGSPAIPGHYQTTEKYVTSYVWVPAGPGRLSLIGYNSPTLTTVTTTVWIPAIPAVPATSGTPATPGQLLRIFNKGWNSHSRSRYSLDNNEGIIFSCATGIEGAVIGIDKKNSSHNSAGYEHGIVVDSAGVKVYENGAVTTTLTSQQSAVTEIRIYRQEDNTIVYCLVTGTETLVYKSLVPLTISPIAALYGYAWLYASGDIITESELLSGQVQFGAA